MPSNQILEKLQSSNAVQRRQAVVAIANSNDEDALDILTRVAETDTDEAIRDLASRAADHVRKAAWHKAEASAPVVKPATQSSTASPLNRAEGMTGGKEIEKAPVVNVREDKKKSAKARMNSAFSARVSGQVDKAITYLRRAIEIDPGLRSDPAAMALAADLMSAGSDEAIDKLMGYKAPDAAEGVAQVAGAATGGVILFVGEAILLLVAQLVIPAILIGSAFALASKYATTIDTATLKATVQTLTTPQYLIRLVGGYVLQSLFLYSVMFFVGVMVGGTGSLMHFIRTMMRVTTALTVGFELLIVVPIFLPSISTAIDLPHNALGIFLIIGLISLGLEAFFAGRAHNFGIMKGCVTIFAGSFAAGCILSLFINFLVRPGLTR